MVCRLVWSVSIYIWSQHPMGKCCGPINHDRLCLINSSYSIIKYKTEITYRLENSYCKGNFFGGNSVLAKHCKHRKWLQLFQINKFHKRIHSIRLKMWNGNHFPSHAYFYWTSLVKWGWEELLLTLCLSCQIWSCLPPNSYIILSHDQLSPSLLILFWDDI